MKKRKQMNKQNPMCKEAAKILTALDNTYSNLSKEGKRLQKESLKKAEKEKGTVW